MFLDGLSAELGRIEKDQTLGDGERSHRLRDYQDKLAGLRFLERNFISFLYFYHLVRSSQSRTEEKPKIVVIDDPVSSMDSSTLYIVGFLVREMIEVCYNKTKNLIEKYELVKQAEIVATMRHFVRFYEFLLQASCFEDVELHKKYNFVTYVLAYINIKHPGGGYNLDGKIKATNFVQKKAEEHVKPDLVAQPVVKLATVELLPDRGKGRTPQSDHCGDQFQDG